MEPFGFHAFGHALHHLRTNKVKQKPNPHADYPNNQGSFAHSPPGVREKKSDSRRKRSSPAAQPAELALVTHAF